MIHRNDGWRILLLALLVTASKTMLVSDPDVFSYDPNDEYGPDNWKYLPVENNECGGGRQSGIDIPLGPCADQAPKYHFRPGNCTLDDLSFTLSNRNVQANFPATGCEAPTMMIPDDTGVAWKAKQLHLHLGSEHALNGTTYAAEIHVVHEPLGEGRGSGERASHISVLGAFLEVSNGRTGSGTFMDGLLRRWEERAESVLASCAHVAGHMPTISTPNSIKPSHLRPQSSTNRFDAYRSLLAKSYSVYQYQGSLTTPPCTESVTWNVVAEPVRVSAVDLDRLRSLILRYVDPGTCEYGSVASKSLLGTTSRPLNPRNGRAVTRYCAVH